MKMKRRIQLILLRKMLNKSKISGTNKTIKSSLLNKTNKEKIIWYLKRYGAVLKSVIKNQLRVLIASSINKHFNVVASLLLQKMISLYFSLVFTKTIRLKCNLANATQTQLWKHLELENPKQLKMFKKQHQLLKVHLNHFHLDVELESCLQVCFLQVLILLHTKITLNLKNKLTLSWVLKVNHKKIKTNER